MQHKHIGRGVLVSLLAWIGIGSLMFTNGGSTLLARVMTPVKKPVPWLIISADDIAKGTSFPTQTNIVFTMPNAVSPLGFITREDLLGGQGNTIRYWGYCLPQSKDELLVKSDTLPGMLFLSEAERAARLKDLQNKLPKFSAFNPPTTSSQIDITNGIIPKGVIRHQKETFNPGDICYITIGGTTPLHVGTDLDADGLNVSLERAYGTDPENADSDADGIPDGIEILVGHTNPLNADTDGDGIPDGTEDANHNGIVDAGETDPNKLDSDGDGLCDGLCSFGRVIPLCDYSSNSGSCIYTNRGWLAGEDKNLNGKVDSGETDPRTQYTDGVHNDYQLYLNCRLAGGSNC